MKTKKLFTLIAAIALCSLGIQNVRAQDIDNFAPVVIKTVPEAGTKNVPPGEYEVKITFSKEMADQSWSWCSAWQNSDPESVDKLHYETDHRTCVMKVKLSPARPMAGGSTARSFTASATHKIIRPFHTCSPSKPVANNLRSKLSSAIRN